MINIRLAIVAVALVLGLSRPSLASPAIQVSATGDLYLAGQPNGLNCCYSDSSPAESPTAAPVTLTAGEVLTFSATGGAAHQPGPIYATPDGDLLGDYGTDYNLTADYGTGISGPTHVHLGALAGVFLGADAPSGPAPAQLTGTDFASISPGLDQIFFIGDGLTGTGVGATQTFTVPGARPGCSSASSTTVATTTTAERSPS